MGKLLQLEIPDSISIKDCLGKMVKTDDGFWSSLLDWKYTDGNRTVYTSALLEFYMICAEKKTLEDLVREGGNE